jgi:hypothetical protein
MDQRDLTLLELVVMVVVIGILTALFLPLTCHPGHGGSKLVSCANNLRQLHTLGTIYASTHQGDWRSETGEALWLSFTRTVPPLIEADWVEILACPLRGEEPGPGETHYRGPRVPWGKLKSPDPLGGDKVGNHGDGRGGNVLYKDGSVTELDPQDLRWRQGEDVLR